MWEMDHPCSARAQLNFQGLFSEYHRVTPVPIVQEVDKNGWGVRAAVTTSGLVAEASIQPQMTPRYHPGHPGWALLGREKILGAPPPMPIWSKLLGLADWDS